MATKKTSAKTKKKTAKKKAPKSRERFAAYPYAEALQIQYEPVRDESGKIQYEMRFDKELKKEVPRLDSKFKKIPVADTNKPILNKSKEPTLKKAKKGGQLPWGFVVIDTGVQKVWTERGKPVTYNACRRRRGSSFEREPVWIREDELQDDRCLEVVFVDIGQGDGCFLVTPENKRMVIDAGINENMRHYLNWRHGTDKETTFEAAIISHPDADHYKGFIPLFQRDNFYFETLYTNGLMERYIPKKSTSKSIKHCEVGPIETIDGVPVVTDLVTNKKELQAFLKKHELWANKLSNREGTKEKKRRGKQFPTMINEAFEGWKLVQKRPRNGKPHEVEFRDKTFGDYRMLSVDDEWMPGYEPKDGRDLTIQVLGPITQKLPNGRKGLKWLKSNISKTKNGHSVVLRLQYKNVSMMLGGDLNIPAEHGLLEHHTGMKSPPEELQKDAFLEAARKVFQVDIAKSCHHGSSDFTHWFLQALNPIATVISSGDRESHSHPRCDTLGAIGSYSRKNPRPLIFSTELARSSEDEHQKPWELQEKISNQVDDILELKSDLDSKTRELEAKDEVSQKDEAEVAKIETKFLEKRAKLKSDLKQDIPRSVAVFGAIHVVTDGVKVIIYQKLETKSSSGEYDIYCLEPSGKDGTGPLVYQTDHHD